MLKVPTRCCALCQIGELNDDTPLWQIKNALTQLKREKEENKEVGYTRTGKGQTACFVIVAPLETKLENNLINLEFKLIHKFSRRKGYPEGMLKMYIKDI